MLNIRNSRIAKGIVAGLIGLQLNALAMGAWADAVTNSYGQARITGMEVQRVFSQNEALTTLTDLFPEPSAASTADLQDVFGKDTETKNIGTAAQGRLATEASMEGSAYRTIQQSGRRISPDLRNDPMFNTADNVRNNEFMQGFKENFADCKATDVFESVQKSAHIANYKTCERINKPSGNCEISHEILIKAAPTDLVFIVDNSASMDPVIASLRISVSQLASILGASNDGDLRLGGVVSRASHYTSNKVGLSENVEGFQSWINSVSTNAGQTYSVNAANYVIDTFDWREGVEKVLVIIGNDDSPNGDVAALRAKMNALGFQAFIFHNVGAQQSIGQFISNNFSAAGLFKMAQFLTVVEDYWTPQSCLDAAVATLEEFCEGSYQETVGGDGGCVNLSGFDVCPGDPIYNQIKAPPIPNVDRLALKVSVSELDCGFNEGQMSCWVDPQGKQQCPDNSGERESTCEQFEANRNCGFISQACIDNATGSKGTCYVFEEIWDCGHSVDYPTTINTGTTYDCPGPVRCMGSECFDNSNVKSGDFAYAVAMLQVAQFAEHDLTCNGEGSLDCKVFKGEAMECKKALGGYVDCCEAPEGVSVFDYVRLTMSSLKMASSIEAFSRTGNYFSPGYWQAAQSGISAGASAITSGNWAGTMDAASHAFKQTIETGAKETIISKFKEQLMKMTYDAMVEVGAESAANAMFQQGATEGGMQLSTQAASVVNFIGAVYTAYVIADLMIKIIWACEEKEFELGAKKETRQCAYVGSYCASKTLGSCVEKRESYCCFGSVVARIIQEQGRPQLGMNFGAAKTPTCDGITANQMQQIDWSRIDLTEWIGMLSMTGHLPTVDTVGLEKLTGSGSSLPDIFNDEGERKNTLDANVLRLEGVNVDEIKREVEIEMLSNTPAIGAE